MKKDIKVIVRNWITLSDGSLCETRNIIRIGIIAIMTVLVAIEKAKKMADKYNAFRNRKNKLTNTNEIGIISN